MNTFAKIAWRNIWRNKRRTLIIISAIAFSVAITIFQLALNDGTHDASIRHSLNIFTGYIQIHQKGYQDDPEVEKAFKPPEKMLKLLENTPQITGYSRRIKAGALIGNKTNSLGGMVVGVVPKDEKKVSKLPERVIEGSYLTADSKREIVIGEKLSKNISAPLGSDIVVFTQGIDGSTGAFKFKVKGIFKSGIDEVDRSMVFVTLEDAGDLLRAYGMVHSIAIVTDTPRNVPEVVGKLKSGISTKEYEVLGWRKLVPQLVQMIMLDDIFGFIFIGLLLLVVIFGVLSALISSVLERTREFGVMLALGTRPLQIVFMVIMESLLLTVVGAVIGLIVGLSVSIYFVHNPITLPADTEDVMSYYGFENKIFAAVYPSRVAIIVGTVVFLALLFSIYPAFKASSLKPDQAMRKANV